MKIKNNWFSILILLIISFGCKPNNVIKENTLPSFNNIIDGRKEGKHLYFDNEGRLYSIIEYKNDSINGECIWYFPNGKIRSKVNYYNGKEDGIAYYFYESGVINCYRKWRNGKKIGYATDYYDVSGETKAGLKYNDNGFLIRRKTFDTLGNLISDEGG